MTEQQAKTTLRQAASLAAIIFIYLVCSFRYFPGRLGDSLIATALHLLEIAPFTIGAVVMVAGIIRKMSGRLPGALVLLRMFLAISLVVEIFFGLYVYLERGGAVAG